MEVRPVIFWSHLVAGVIAGLVVLMMSLTGVLHTYERQIVAWVENSYLEKESGDFEMLRADELIAVVRGAAPNAEQITLAYSSNPESVMRSSAGRGRDFLIDPYRGEILRIGPTAIERFFTTVTDLHRWFALTGDSRAIGRAVT